MEDFKNGSEDFKDGMEDDLPYCHNDSILDFDHGIYSKIYTDSDKYYSHRSAQHLFYNLSTNRDTSVACT